jgi:hypothetical protein
MFVFSQLYDLLQDYSAIGEYVLVFDEFVVSTHLLEIRIRF